jgi:hypothetical protein
MHDSMSRFQIKSLLSMTPIPIDGASQRHKPNRVAEFTTSPLVTHVLLWRHIRGHGYHENLYWYFFLEETTPFVH